MHLYHEFSCIVCANSVSLHCVFHGIRFKVNKGWGAAAPLFFALFVPDLLSQQTSDTLK